MKLYKIEASNWETFFGTPEERIERDVRTIAQTPSNDAFLLLAKDTFDELELLDSVPTGFDFTRRDSLGVVIRDIPTLLRDTIAWIQSDPFKGEQNI